MSTLAEIDSGPAIDIMIEAPLWEAVPDLEHVIRRALRTADSVVDKRPRAREVAVLLCDDAAMAELNARWRGENHATNVLSFPAAPATADAAVRAPLGDIAVAYETASREAAEQNKQFADHVAHLVVHGFLHLFGYDHLEDAEAERMERLERNILARIGIADPYALRDAGL
jgi:probable rRNA maturation factor